ncbi:serine hydrolase domain-containing protein [Sphingopyxis sp. JAI128]|uniref:serine hydrolase domain-containing protein n=1 Tax=Sphingopyxis sp. JAI128 TaxID=2723066 RepID=UPI0017D472C0|nr:serine hydrolase domain-containing protein [Sphingopyxis sp. JAI128]MBB6426859.1 CubicO group peptidase (beta-lactamase class C family) [Sphingopyxis sp. JAI128]
MTANDLAEVNVEGVRAAMAAAVESGAETGLHVVAYHRGRKIIDLWEGVADPATGRKVEADTLFNVYSVTKAVTATALHIQAERGHVDYDAPIATYWPEFAAGGKEGATVRHALTHRVGVPQMPEGVTPEMMCDWNAMTTAIAALPPLAPPGEKTLYQSMTFGWIVGEIVRRTDPEGRDFRQFILDEICASLGLADLWLGIPDAAEPRVAIMSDRNAGDPPPPLATLFSQSMPPQVALVPPVFERPDVRRACIPGVGGIFNARDEARFWALLAEGGALDGVRLLSEERVAGFSNVRDNGDEPDPVMFGIPIPISTGGYWLGGHRVSSPRAIWHPGAGGSIGWADPDNRLAVAICHNRMFNTRTVEDDPILPISHAVMAAVGLEA